MGRYADLRRAFLEECKPQLYLELQQAGRLESHCRAREKQALARKRRLMTGGGIRDYEADEFVRADLCDQ